jgi:hypothetical protein
VDAFRRHGIYPRGLRTYSEESLRWQEVQEPADLAKALQTIGKQLLGDFFQNTPYFSSRAEAFQETRSMRANIHDLIEAHFTSCELDEAQHKLTGIVLTPHHQYLKKNPKHGIEFKQGRPKFEVHALRTAQRVTPDGAIKNDTIIVLNQKRTVVDPDSGREIEFRGGATLILDAYTYDLRYAISRDITDDERLKRHIMHINTFGGGTSLFANYFRDPPGNQSPFALLHSGLS